MIRVAISVEGPTERDFCKDVLTPYFLDYDIYLEPVTITTSKDRCGRKNSGGCVNIDRVKNEIQKLLPSYDYVTTLYDLYGFQGVESDITVDELEKILYDMFNTDKFIPYIQKYEFETLLFSNPEYYKEIFDNQNISEDISKIVDEFQNIELINNSKQTAPSKRLIAIFDKYGEKYDKVFYGAAITQDIGIDTIREKAIRFDRWIKEIIDIKTIKEILLVCQKDIVKC